MDISKLLFNEILADLKIGNPVHSENDLEVITEQDGNIPSITNFTINSFDFEVIILNEIIIGIQYDFTYEAPYELFFKIDVEKLLMSRNLTSKNVENFLKHNKINFDFFESNQEPFTIKFKNSNSKLYFDNNHQLLKISVFDMELYRKMITDM